MHHVITVACGSLLLGCGQPSEKASPEVEPAVAAPGLAPLSELGPRELLLECAGAIVAQSGLDPLAEPSLGTAAENSYFVVLALMDKEPGLEGMSGREAAAVARDAWLERESGLRAERADQCFARFPG